MNTYPQSDDAVRTCYHCAGQWRQLTERHWLLDAVYGRELLKHKLRQQRPDLHVPTWREPEHLDPLLDRMVDLLGLHGWKRPAGIKERVRYLQTVLQMMLAVRAGRELPSL